jgi:hypothetical protein
MKFRASTILLILSSLMAVLFFCTDFPGNPVENPDNVKIKLFTKDNNEIIHVGSTCDVGLAVLLSKHIKSLHLYSSCGQIDTEVTTTTDKIYDTLYFSPQFKTAGPCQLIATADLSDSTLADKKDTLFVHVYPAQAQIKFTRKADRLATHSGVMDTLEFVTSVAGSVILPPSYTLSSVPPLNESQLYMVYSSIKDTIYLIVNHAPADTYRVAIIAKVGVPNENPVYDTATIGLKVYKAIEMIAANAPQTVATGSRDTLTFTVNNVSREDSLTISLVNKASFDPTLATVLPSSPDSVVIAVSPTTSGELNIEMMVTNGILTDTIRYPITFIDQKSALWNMTAVSIGALEGKVLRHDLKQYFIRPVNGEVVFTADKGTITNDTVWEWTPGWGSETMVIAAITAQCNAVSRTLRLEVGVTPGDNDPPTIRLTDTTLIGKKVSAPQITVNCIVKDIGAGVDKVTFMCGTKATDATLQKDSVYSGIIYNLAPNQKTDISINATDRSMKKNNGSMQLYVIYDSTLEDGEPPVMEYVSGPKSGERVSSAKGTITYTISDNTGVDSVWWQLNGANSPRQPLLRLGGGKCALTYSLTSFGSNSISIYASDGSTNKNCGSVTILLNYNTIPTGVEPTTPTENQTGIDTLPTFSWKGGDDADGDVVFYRVRYGTTQGNLPFSTGEISVKSVKLQPGNQLKPLSRYYWQVIAYSKAFPDSVASVIVPFTTLDVDTKGPQIVQVGGPADSARDTTGTGTIKVNVSDPNGVDSVYVILNGVTKTLLTSSEGGVYAYSYAFSKYGWQQMVIHATDKSIGHNRQTLTLNLNYNTRVAAIDSLDPINGKQGVDTLPRLSWSGGNDKDGDTVYYKVKYGLSLGNLNLATGELKKKSYLFPATSKLASFTQYFWQIVAWSKAFPDTVQSAIVSFTTLNPAAEDKTEPTIEQTAGPENGSRVTSKTGSFTITVTDNSGIDSVYASLNGGTKSVLSSTDGKTYKCQYDFTFGQNSVVFEAVDKSANRNRRRVTVAVTFNTLISALSLKSPANNAIEIDTHPTFRWTGGKDDDGDPVFYRIYYGLTAATLTRFTLETTDSVWTLLLSLAANTTYYWQVYAYSKVNQDNVKSDIWSFTTLVPKYTLLYQKNGGTGPIPLDTGRYTAGSTCIVKDAAGTLVKDGFKFAGWNTAADGSGTTYQANDIFTFSNNDDTLYALWKINAGGRYAYYPFNGNANDASGNSHHLTVFGAVLTEDRNGQANSAYLFDGVDDYLQLANMSDFASGTTPRTIAGWFQSSRNDNSKYMMLFGFGTAKDTLNFQVGSGPCSGEYQFRVNGWGTPRDWCSGTASSDFFNGQWHHCAVTYDGTITKLYLDGVLKNETSGYTYICDPASMSMVIGREIDLSGWEFEGALDDVAIYMKALTATEVQSLFTDQE